MVNLVKNPVWAVFAKKPVNQETQITMGVTARLSLTALKTVISTRLKITARPPLHP